MADRSIKPKFSNQKRPVNPDAKLSGFKDFCYLQLHQDIATFPTRPALTSQLGDKEYITAVTGETANKPFGTSTFIKCELVKNKTKLAGDGDFSKNSTNVKSTVEVMLYADKDSKGFAAKLRAADVHVIVPKYSGEMIWLGDKDVPAKVTKYALKEESEEDGITLTIEFEPYMPLALADGSLIDTVADA